MPQLYVLRRLSSWSFRLSVSVALLVSSAGLAASVLVDAATDPANVTAISWQPTAHLAQTASELRPDQLGSSAMLPESLRRVAPAYALAPGGPVARPDTVQLIDQPAVTPPLFLAVSSSFKTTMQRSWSTFKLAFR